MDLLINRKFQLWDYNVSHQQLLIRSPIGVEHSTNVDILFAGVSYMALPTFLGEVSILEPTKNEIDFADSFTTGNYTPRVFVLGANSERYIILAAGMKIEENELDRMVSSLEYYNRGLE